MRCVVATCQHNFNAAPRGVTFHPFPNEPSLRDSWLQSLGKEGWVPSAASLVCSDHFEKCDLTVDQRGQRLRAGALPSVTVQVCRMCLATGGRLLPLRERPGLQQAYHTLTGLAPESGDGLPQQLCATCARLLLSHRRLRARALRAHAALSSLARDRHQITFKALQSIKGNVSQYSANLEIKLYKPDHYDLEIKHVEDENACTDRANHDEDSIAQKNNEPATVKDEKESNLNSQTSFEDSNIKLEYDCVGRAVESKEEMLEELYESTPEHGDNRVEYNCAPNLEHYNIEIENDCASSLEDSRVKEEPNFETDDIKVEISAPSQEDCDIKVFKTEMVVTRKHIHGAVATEVEKIIIRKKPIDEDASSSRDARSNDPAIMDSDVVKDTVDDSQTTLGDGSSQPVRAVDTVLSDNVETLCCVLCPYQTTNEKYFVSHLKAHGSSKSLDCAMCHYKTINKNHLMKHVRTHVGEKPYSCGICKKTINGKSFFIKHLKIHSREKPYSCNICNKQFSERSVLQIHFRTHSGESSYPCYICNEVFSLKCNLQTHLRTHSDEKTFSCNICKKVFSHKSNLLTHLRTHSGEKPYSCDICKNVFSHKSNLLTHLRTHSGEKPYSCDMCKKIFSHKSNLLTHLRTHSGEKPYTCDICGKSFKNVSYLKCHLRTHSGEKPYTCDICKKSFSKSSHLKSHLRTHSGEKPYSCDKCKKAFSEVSILKRHLTTHSGEKPYSCDICKKLFRYLSTLKIHLRTHSVD